MYNLPYFKAKGQKEVVDFMHQHPFIVLTGVDADHHPVATHVPVLIEERQGKLFLLAHIMKQTDHHRAFLANPSVLAVFSGPHAYISASWYKDQRQASTWNYQAVHVKGNLQFLGEDALLEILQRLTAHFENIPSSPSLVQHLPPDYVKRLIKAIVAFEIEVTNVDHIFKLSQNRDEESYSNIVHELRKGTPEAQLVASVMESNAKI